mmetsp:Transcript_41138/g.122946  ORF Transcript_41138/g.122946 Transcript_41138/m.122946 type:complete len:246 (+) Transcript_41138:215-952(+)
MPLAARSRTFGSPNTGLSSLINSSWNAGRCPWKDASALTACRRVQLARMKALGFTTRRAWPTMGPLLARCLLKGWRASSGTPMGCDAYAHLSTQLLRMKICSKWPCLPAELLAWGSPCFAARFITERASFFTSPPPIEAPQPFSSFSSTCMDTVEAAYPERKTCVGVASGSGDTSEVEQQMPTALKSLLWSWSGHFGKASRTAAASGSLSKGFLRSLGRDPCLAEKRNRTLATAACTSYTRAGEL